MCLPKALYERAVGFESIKAGVAQPMLAKVDPLDRVRRCHRAPIILTVSQVQRVSKLVNRFLQKSLSHQRIVVWQAVEFLTQPIRRDDAARSTQLRLAEYVLENRNVKINLGHSKNPPTLRSHDTVHSLEDLRRMKLLALGVIRGHRIEGNRQYFATERKPFRDRSAQFLH